jgi:hypothetical protein
MSTDAAAATAAPTEIQALGRTWKVSPLRMKGIGAIQAWINKHPRPNPVAELRAQLAGFDEATINELVKPAVQENLVWPPDLIFDDRGREMAFRSEEARRLIVYHAVSPNHKGLTEQEAADILDDLSVGQWLELITAAFKVEGGRDDEGPKGQSGGPSTT